MASCSQLALYQKREAFRTFFRRYVLNGVYCPSIIYHCRKTTTRGVNLTNKRGCLYVRTSTDNCITPPSSMGQVCRKVSRQLGRIF